MRRGCRGFTLLEVLMALCVFLIAISAILPLFAVGTASHKRGMDQTMVSLMAQQIFGRLQEGLYVDRGNVPKPIKDALIDYQGHRFLYDAAFEPLEPADLSRPAYLVRVSIKWDEAGIRQSEEFRTILLRRVKR